jgi:Tfp pilus assembly protein PilF
VALSDLGLAMVEKKRYGEAKVYLLKAIELRPRYALPHVHLARVYLAEGQLVAAEAEFRKAVAIYPMSASARNALGKFYFEQGRFAEAEAQYRASNDSLPNDEAWNRLGDIYFHDGQTRKAQKGCLAPFDSHAHLALDGIYFADGRRTEAEKEYRDVLFMDPSNAEARERLQKLGATKIPPAPSFHP